LASLATTSKNEIIWHNEGYTGLLVVALGDGADEFHAFGSVFSCGYGGTDKLPSIAPGQKKRHFAAEGEPTSTHYCGRLLQVRRTLPPGIKPELVNKMKKINYLPEDALAGLRPTP